MAGSRQRYGQTVYPFAALVGQDLLKLGLLLNAVNPAIGGILISGEKGTAKSTAVRALAGILPEIEVVQGCPFRCDPRSETDLCDVCRSELRAGETLPVAERRVEVVTLPLNATEDRLAGSLDFEQALQIGRACFRPGLLAEANRNILYIDEVNLLEDHIADILLDVAVTGMNIVQREAVSHVHPSRFILAATMNPEEGAIRPQLLDRFGLAVAVKGTVDPEQRREIIRRCEGFEADPDGFASRWQEEQDRLKDMIIKARDLLGSVTIPGDLVRAVSDICRANRVAGHRADIIMEKTARTLAALRGGVEVEPDDVGAAAQLALPHRRREPQVVRPARAGRPSEARAADAVENLRTGRPEGENRERPGGAGPEPERERRPTGGTATGAPPEESRPGAGEQALPPEAGNAGERIFGVGRGVFISTAEMKFERERLPGRGGRRRQTRSAGDRRGRYVRATCRRGNDDLAFDATLRAAAPYQKKRSPTGLAVTIERSDIREKVRRKNSSALLLFVVDASGSMGTRLMAETKSAILSLLVEAYQKRDRVGLVAFKDEKAEVLLPPTNSVELAQKLLEKLPTGGRTPLGMGLLVSYQLIRSQLRRSPATFPLMILITDGRANVGMDRNRIYEGPAFGRIYREIFDTCELLRAEKRLRTVVIDTEEKNPGSFDRARKLAEALDARYYILEEIVSGAILQAVERETEIVFAVPDKSK